VREEIIETKSGEQIMKKNNKIIFTFLFLIFLCVTIAGAVDKDSHKSGWYVHPQLGFKLIPPPGWRVDEHPQDADIQFVSPDEHTIFQVSSATPKVNFDLERFVDYWESEEVGEGKHLLKRLEREYVVVGGYPAIRAVYVNKENITVERFFIKANGMIYALSGVFVGEEFKQRVNQFDMMAYSFQPPENLTQQPETAKTPLAQPQAAPQQEVVPPEDKSLGNIFQEKGLGYAIRYPSGWAAKKPDPYSVVIGGKEGTRAYSSTVSIQNMTAADSVGKQRSLDSVVAEFKQQLKSGDANAKFSEEKAFSYAKNGLNLIGRQLKVEFTLKGQKYKEWLIVVPRTDRGVFFGWMYTSVASQYDMFSWVTKAMLDSWTIFP
jgi:hypothetical protein